MSIIKNIKSIGNTMVSNARNNWRKAKEDNFKEFRARAAQDALDCVQSSAIPALLLVHNVVVTKKLGRQYGVGTKFRAIEKSYEALGNKRTNTLTNNEFDFLTSKKALDSKTGTAQVCWIALQYGAPFVVRAIRGF